MSTNMVPTGLTVQQWDEKYFTDFVGRNYFNKFMGSEQTALIHLQEDLTTKPGNSVTYTLINQLVGDAKGENDVLEGNEEEADLRSQKVTIREYKHAVKWKTYDEQLTAIDLRNGLRGTLMQWNMKLDRTNIIEAMRSVDGVLYNSSTAAQRNTWLTNNADRVQFGKLRSNGSSNVHATALATLDYTDDLLTPDAISLMKGLANECNPRIAPFMPRKSIGDSEAYVLFVGSRSFRNLQKNSVFQQANREGRERGKDNPIFSGADLVWDGIPIYKIDEMPILTGVGNSSADVQPCFLCGAQALAIAWAKRPQTVDETFDYKSRKGIAVKQWYKVEKLRFGTGPDDTDTPKDHGIVTGFFAAQPDA